MKLEPAPRRIAGLGLSCALLWTAVGTTAAMAQTAVPPEWPATLNAVDFNFVGQANLGAPFQVDFGTIGRSQGTTRSYAHHVCYIGIFPWTRSHLSGLNTTADNGCRSTGVRDAGNGRKIGS